MRLKKKRLWGYLNYVWHWFDFLISVYGRFFVFTIAQSIVDNFIIDHLTM